ncbi:hypothetical protein [Sphingomonas sp. MMS24-J13]|uniref:hypothetical protein n=1 Tax=Sphingomonas sp. MMS24-J13 TaxID=3238686 RepID=UPI003851570F
MSRSLLMAAASLALLLPAAASAAPGDTHVRAEAGALAGRSPHQAFRPIAATPATCGKTMHSIPAGKLPSYGTHAFPKADCTVTEVAAASGSGAIRASR